MSETKSDHGTRDTHRGSHASARATPAPRDATADQLNLLLLLTADWLNGDRTHAEEIAGLLAGLVATLGPPTVVDVPYASQSDDGATLSCTVGNWNGQPTEYAYAWHKDGVPTGSVDMPYAVQPDDSGHSLACVVTATNALGSTAAPMSNSVAVA